MTHENELDVNASIPEEGTAAAALKHRDPLTPQSFKTPSGTFVYDYKKLTAVQVMAAEELANWKKEQIEQPAPDFRTVERSGSTFYTLDLAAILLVGTTGKQRRAYDHDKRHETRKALEQMTDPEQYTRLESCLRDFFTRRGKRRLASITLSRVNVGRLLSLLSTQGATAISSGNSSASSDSGTPAKPSDA